MQAVGANGPGQRLVRAGQQNQAAAIGDGAQAQPLGHSIRCAESPKHHPRAARQAFGDGLGVWNSVWIGEEKQAGQG